MKLLFATTNQGKLREALQILSEIDLELLSLDSFKKLQDVVVEESGETFEQNAFLKAKFYGDKAQILTVAEDAGLMVDALDGQPGVHSARFGSNGGKRNSKLLRKMKGKENRLAKFISTLCLYNTLTKQSQYFKGIVDGSIAKEKRGNEGFDYDCVFIPQGYTQTFAELGVEVKNQISHRKLALDELKNGLG